MLRIKKTSMSFSVFSFTPAEYGILTVASGLIFLVPAFIASGFSYSHRNNAEMFWRGLAVGHGLIILLAIGLTALLLSNVDYKNNLHERNYENAGAFIKHILDGFVLEIGLMALLSVLILVKLVWLQDYSLLKRLAIALGSSTLSFGLFVVWLAICWSRSVSKK